MAISSRASSSPSAVRSKEGLIYLACLACVSFMLALSACRNVLNDDEEDDSFQVRMVNLIEDSPAVQYSVDSTVITNIGYLGATGFNAAHPGDRAVSFAAIRPASLNSSDTTTPIAIGGTFSQSYTRGRDYTVFVYGKLNDPKAFTMDEESDKAAVEEDFIEYQFVNAAPNVPRVDIFITAPEGQITSAEKLATVTFGQKTGTTKLKLFKRADVTDDTAALIVDFTVELRDSTSGDVLFNSGKQRLNEKTRLLWAVVNNTGPGPAKVKVIGIDGVTGTFLNTTDQATVRAVHVSPDSGAFDIYRNSSLNSPIALGLAFRDTSPYSNVPTGEVDLIAQPASATSVTILFVEEFSAIANTSYSAYTVGRQGSVDALVIADDRRSVPTQSKFRFLNAAPSLDGEDALDVYVTLPDQSLDFTASTTATTDDAAQFKRGSIAYKSTTDPAVLKSGTYRVRLAPAGTSRIVLDSAITLQDGSVQTFVLIDDPDSAELELMPVEEALVQ